MLEMNLQPHLCTRCLLELLDRYPRLVKRTKPVEVPKEECDNCKPKLGKEQS
jgi:hypothetical protein